jgi:hypothetical protein
MYISNLKHFLNKKGDIPREMPPEAREMAGFLVMVVDITTENRNTKLAPSTLRCFNSGCNGLVQTALTPNQIEIHWYCPDCKEEGIISHWQKTKWDNL